MTADFETQERYEGEWGHVFVTFSNGPDPRWCRVVGPFDVVRLHGTALWAYVGSEEPLRVATQEDDLSWRLDGLDECRFRDAEVVAMAQPCTARALEARFNSTLPR